MYSTHTAGKSVVAEMFIKTLKSEIYKTMTHNKKFYLGYLNKLVDEYNTLIIVLLVKNLLMLIFLP